ncbi:DUF4270 domain-containing protein [Zunongwangia endophytica]|uniref:DUF4270 domain-containing protein n=1 Tax=Zunongwangia endophytica TaxID=1808945 RepID=A0ABV8H992_9FLAO|nr:DUF4270 domain-containing protein [Zunongwangia endophytica]MDN3595657.1 DUF4270 domain-containing protein [Zunongwangia endophytica]
MNLYRRILKIATVPVVIFLLASCDEDFSNVGGEVIGNPSGVEVREYDINAYTVDLKSIESNRNFLVGVSPNQITHYPRLLGVYNHPVFGQKLASVLSQVSISQTSPQFPDGAILDSVVLNMPYYSRETRNADGDSEYTLDSIYGSGAFKLSIYESNYFLSDYDPDQNFEKRQKYYSDQQDVFEQFLNDDPIYVNENFTPSANRIRIIRPNGEGENDTVYNAPSLRVKLDKEFFQQKIFDKEGSQELSSQSNFKDYFRGLFLKAEPVGNSGSMILFNFASSSGVKMYYSYEEETTDDEDQTVDVKVIDSLGLNFTGNRVNTFKGEYPQQVQEDIANRSDNLYIDGGEGTIGVVELFNDVELEDLRAENLIINEANLELYLKSDEMGGAEEPSRIYLYDIDNNSVLVDYNINQSDVNQNAFNSRLIFSSKPETDEETGVTKYTLRLTQHIFNLIENDSSNVRLGIAVTSNINQAGNIAAKESTPVLTGDNKLDVVPAASAITPEGAVFYGSEASNEDRRFKLRIYYTDADQ